MSERFQQLSGSGFSLHLWNGIVAFVTVMIISSILNSVIENDQDQIADSKQRYRLNY